MRTRVALASVVALLAAGCSGSPGSDPEPSGAGGAPGTASAGQPAGGASEPTSPGGAGAGPALTPPFVITTGGAPASTKMGPAGGTLAVTGEDGTTYELAVPAGALLETVRVTVTPVTSFGTGNAGGRGVVFAPTGLQFAKDATLTATPADELPVDRQLVFEFSDDGDEVIAAEPVLDDPAVVMYVGHFSGYGFADLADAARETWVGWRTERKEAQIQDEVRDLLSKERMSQLLGEEGDPDTSKKFEDASRRYETEVVRRRLDNADTSCAAAKEAVRTALGHLRTRELLGLPPVFPDQPLTFEQVVGVVMKPCEKDAIARCRAAHDPKILLDFWTGANTLLPGSFVVDSTRADLVCDPKAYRVVGGLESFQVSQEVCNVMEPFSLDSDIGSMELSGGLKGTYEFTGDYDAHYRGTYSISFPHGPRKPGTMTGHGSGTVAGQGGSGTEKFTLTPIGPAC